MEEKKEKQQSSEIAISSMVSDFKSSLAGAAGAEIENMANVINGATSVMSNFAENNKELESRVNYMIETLDNTIKSQQTQFTTYIQEINSIINSQVLGIKDIYNELDQKMTQYKSLIATTSDLQENMQSVAEKLLSASHNFSESATSFEYINDSIEQLKELSEQELNRFNESINQWNVQVNAIKAVENSISNILEKVHESLVGYSEQTNNSLKEYLSQYDEQMTNITRHFSFSIQEFDEKLGELNEILERKIGVNN